MPYTRNTIDELIHLYKKSAHCNPEINYHQMYGHIKPVGGTFAKEGRQSGVSKGMELNIY